MSGHTIRYSDGVETILLAVPWELGQGVIPPPLIEFDQAVGDSRFITRTFAYRGERTYMEDDDG
jgi:hypothetical protein